LSGMTVEDPIRVKKKTGTPKVGGLKRVVHPTKFPQRKNSLKEKDGKKKHGERTIRSQKLGEMQKKETLKMRQDTELGTKQ